MNLLLPLLVNVELLLLMQDLGRHASFPFSGEMPTVEGLGVIQDSGGVVDEAVPRDAPEKSLLTTL